MRRDGGRTPSPFYRIYRDVRFSPDKRRTKTHIAAIIQCPAESQSMPGQSLLPLAPEEVLIAGGVYMPAARPSFLCNPRQIGQPL